MQQCDERADGDDEQAKPDRRTSAMRGQRLLGVFPGLKIDTVRLVYHDALRFKQADLPVAQARRRCSCGGSADRLVLRA
jgi:hypothetical protein